MFTILFKSHVHFLFNFKNVLQHFVTDLDPLFHFMLQYEPVTAKEILSKMFADSAQVVSNHQQLPGRFGQMFLLTNGYSEQRTFLVQQNKPFSSASLHNTKIKILRMHAPRVLKTTILLF